MTKTKIQKVLAFIAIAWMAFANVWTPGSVFAISQIGTGSVSWTWAFDSAINWDDSFPWSASGSVSNIKIKARVLPTLNMAVSLSEIDLGTLVAWTASTGSLFLEVWTNAKAWVSITARSSSGWLTNTEDSAIVINTGSLDGISWEHFTYTAIKNATDDSASAAFSASWIAETEVYDTTEHTIYTTNKWESTTAVDDVEFIVSATAVTETPAWDYEDTVTFTVTGNF